MRTIKSRKMRRAQKLYDSQQLLDQVFNLLKLDLEIPESWIDVRKYSGPTFANAGPYTFKKLAQITKFWKRIIRKDDPTEEDLRNKTFALFIRDQSSYGQIQECEITRRLIPVVRDIVFEILGDFEWQLFSHHCRFGKKAARFLKQRESYLDTRLGSLNGSMDQWEMFKCVLSEDVHLMRAYRQRKNFAVVNSVKAAAAPKSFEISRMVFPDTVLGGFLSRGLGDYLRLKLEKGTKIDLSTQAEYHKVLAKLASIMGHLATLDMSKASDSFVWKHIEMFMPASWLPILRIVRTANYECEIEGEKFSGEFNSFMLMGSGHTFPLQTLLFYAITTAVMRLFGSRKQACVYGDDIIVPTRFALPCIRSLQLLGFQINENKSFISGPFRESCGGDYHTGVDVRPFMLEHVCSDLKRNEYAALIHKVANGLLERWEYVEVKKTYDYLLSQMRLIGLDLCELPVHGLCKPPSYAGFYFIPRGWECRRVTVRDGIDVYTQLRLKRKMRRYQHERIYYWQALRSEQYQDIWAKEPNDYQDADSGYEPMKGTREQYMFE